MVNKAQAATRQEISYEALLDHLHDGVFFVDENRLITYWNRGAERITGFSREDVLGSLCRAGFPEHLNQEEKPVYADAPAHLCLKDSEVREEELFLRHKEGHLVPVLNRVSPITNSRGDTIGALEVFSDNSSKVNAKQRIEELEEMALLCPMTEVGNRRYAEMTLQSSFEELRRYGWTFGLLFIDVDHFKNLNDEYGHAIGDQVLNMIAQALKSSLRSFDFVGRWGGEEFLVILPNLNEEILQLVAERCRKLIEESTLQHEGKAIKTTVSIGAALAHPDESAESLVDRADRLMYQSKANGRNQVSVERELG